VEERLTRCGAGGERGVQLLPCWKGDHTSLQGLNFKCIVGLNICQLRQHVLERSFNSPVPPRCPRPLRRSSPASYAASGG